MSRFVIHLFKKKAKATTRGTEKSKDSSSKPVLSEVLDSLPFEWDYEKNKGIDPNSLTIGSGKDVYWLCPEGHSFIRNPQRIVILKQCPVCRSFRVGDLIRKKLPNEWDYEKNIDINLDDLDIDINRSVWWKCSKCHKSWSCPIFCRIYNETGCPHCVIEAQQKSVYQYDMSYRFIKEWPSITEATSTLHIGKCYIKQVCEGKRYQAGGYFWAYSDGSEGGSGDNS